MKHARGNTQRGGLLHSQRFEREPRAECDQNIRDERDEQVALDLHVDFLEDPHGVLLA